MSQTDPLDPDASLLLTQLICTRLCHDLAGPIGAVAAGVELAGDDPSQIDTETLSLIGSSSVAASRKLKFLRAALGVPSATSSAVANLDVLVTSYLEATAGRGGVAKLQWPSDAEIAALAAKVGAMTAPLMLNLCLLVVEALPVCQTLQLTIGLDVGVRIVVEGHGEARREAAWRPDVIDALAPTPTMAPSAKSIHAHFARKLAEGTGGRLVLQAESPVLRAVFELVRPGN